MRKNSPSLQDIITYLPLLTVITLAFGYIGFYTFISIYQIPIYAPDISLVGGIGIINFAFFILLFFIATRKRRPLISEAFIAYGILIFIVGNPLITAGLITLQLFLYYIELSITSLRKRKPKELLKNVNK